MSDRRQNTGEQGEPWPHSGEVGEGERGEGRGGLWCRQHGESMF